MQLDSIDIKILKENFDDYIIKQLDFENVSKIYNYLIKEVNINILVATVDEYGKVTLTGNSNYFDFEMNLNYL